MPATASQSSDPRRPFGGDCQNASVSVIRSVLFRLATSVLFEQVVRAAPRGEWLARRAAARYVAGTVPTQAFQLARELHARGVGSSIDHFGELAVDMSVVQRVVMDYLKLADDLVTQPQDTWLSIDLSHLGLDLDPRACAEHLTAIAGRLPPNRRIQIGAESHDRAEAVLECVLSVAGQGLADRLGATVQANFRRSPGDLRRLIEAGVHVRLVKGAYVEPIHRALPYGEATDIAYLRLAHDLAEAGAEFALATHDGVLREALLADLGVRPVEQLLGVRPSVPDDLVARDVPVRVYVPFGNDWFRYWMRRVAESRGS